MLAGLLSSEEVGSLFNSCPWEVHCFVAQCVAGELMRGEPICFLFSVCSLLSPALWPCPSHFSSLRLPSDLRYLPLRPFLSPSIPFATPSPGSQKKQNEKCTQNLPPIALSLPRLPEMETWTWRTFPSITRRQINQSDL